MLRSVYGIFIAVTFLALALSQDTEESRRNPNRKKAETDCTNCVEGTCDNVTGICEECLKGFHGQKCEKTCPNTCPSCQKTSGRCLSCRDGWFGPHCFFKCVLCFSCEIQSGTCTTCRPTKWGPHCQDDCSPNCYICRIHNGQCVQCSRGFYGEKCAKRCPNCFRGLCRSKTGVCHFGCEKGFYGRFCEKSCPSNCEMCDKNDGTCKLDKSAKPTKQGSSLAKEKENMQNKDSKSDKGKKPWTLTIISNPKSKLTSDTSNSASQTNNVKSFSKKMASDVHVLEEGAIVKATQKDQTNKDKPHTAKSSSLSLPVEKSTSLLEDGNLNAAMKGESVVAGKEQRIGNLTVITNPLTKLTSNMSNAASQADNSKKMATDLHILMEGHLDNSNKGTQNKGSVKNSDTLSKTVKNVKKSNNATSPEFRT